MSIGSSNRAVPAASPRGLPLSRKALLIAAAVLAAAALAAVVAVALGGSGSSRSADGLATQASAHLDASSSAAAAGHGATTKGTQSTRQSTAHRVGAHTGAAHTGTHSQAPASATGNAVAGRVAVAEVRDPEEAKSFPEPASVRHKAAKTPSVAAEAAVAPGAASDAQIKKELGEEERAKAQEHTAANVSLAPVPGGFSVGGNGTIPIPQNIPEAVQRVIAGGNAIADFPYIWGGGHGSFIDKGYDCSGSVSYALAAGGLLNAPLVSGELASWGEPGPGRWITIYANAGHTFMDVDGMWFDTAGRSGPYASRWLVSTPPLEGYAVRHPPGL